MANKKNKIQYARKRDYAGTDVGKMVADYKRLAKQIDTRMMRIRQDVASGKLQKYPDVYKSAMKMARRYSGDQSTKFERVPKLRLKSDGTINMLSVQRLQQRLDWMQSWLDKPTTTRPGRKKIAEKRARSLDVKNAETGKGGFGFKISADQLEKFFEHEGTKRLFQKLGSETALKEIAKIQHKTNKDEIINAIKKYQVDHLDLLDVEVKDAMKSFLQNTHNRKLVYELLK